MIEKQLAKAQSLIQKGRYVEARRILVMLDHPTADRLLIQLDEIMAHSGKGDAHWPVLPIRFSRRFIALSALLIVFFVVGITIVAMLTMTRDVSFDEIAVTYPPYENVDAMTAYSVTLTASVDATQTAVGNNHP